MRTLSLALALAVGAAAFTLAQAETTGPRKPPTQSRQQPIADTTKDTKDSGNSTASRPKGGLCDPGCSWTVLRGCVCGPLGPKASPR